MSNKYYIVSTECLFPFQGFPHQWELYIVGHILRVFSMIGLILTIVSYVLIR